MPERTPQRFRYAHGYWPTTSLVSGVQDCLLGGQNVWCRGSGLLVSAKGFGGPVDDAGGPVNPLLNVSDTHGGLTGGGSIVQAFGDGIYWYAGAGEAFVGGESKGSVAGGSIMIWLNDMAVQAGLLPPGKPTIAVDEGTEGRARGSVAIGLTAIRKKTGGESNISPPSNAVVTNKKAIQITELGTMPDGATRVGIYGTKIGFGEIGPLFHLYDVKLQNLNLPYTIQLPDDPLAGWTNGQLGDLAPTEYDPPPSCGFVFACNAVMVAAGCYGGAGLSPSWPGKPEAFPPRFVVFIPGGGKVTAVKGSGIEGAVLVCTGSSVNLVTAGQTDIPFVGPLNIRPIWPTTGVNSANQIATVGAEIFAWVGTRGPVRDTFASEGDPGDQATAFAEPVMKFFEVNGYAADNVVVVYDPDSDSVFYVNGTMGIGYCRYLRQWHTPFTFPVPIVTAVTDIVNGRALFSDDGGSLYQLETGNGVDWSIVTQQQGGEFASFIRTVIGARGLVSRQCRMDIFTDLEIDAPNPYGSNLVAAPNFGSFHHLGIPDVKSFGVGFSGDAAAEATELYGAECLEVVHPVRA